MGEREDDAGLFVQQGFKPTGFLERQGKRLVADHMNACFNEGFSGRHMNVVWRYNGNGLNSIRPCGFSLRHGGIIGIDAVCGEVQFLARGFGACRISRQGTGDEFILVVHAGRQPVHRTDEGTLPATHHSQPDAARYFRIASARNCHFHIPKRRLIFALSTLPPAKSSNAFSVTRMIWFWMKGAPSRAPSSGCLRQHSHSRTAQLA